LPVYAYDSATYTGYSSTTNISGTATLVRPNGSYRFRVDKSGQQYFSGAANHCAIPGCTSVPITITPPTQTTVINYTYDPLYRLTQVQATGGYTGTFGYSYDAVGNRLTQNANGVMTNYAYDQANRLKAVSGQPSAVSFSYNGLGDRLSQTVGGTQTRYALDPSTSLRAGLNAGLTQVLSDGSSAYLYGNGRIAQYQTAMHAFSSFGADALGSVTMALGKACAFRLVFLKPSSEIFFS
jgi:hypothetical protein